MRENLELRDREKGTKLPNIQGRQSFPKVYLREHNNEKAPNIWRLKQ